MSALERPMPAEVTEDLVRVALNRMAAAAEALKTLAAAAPVDKAMLDRFVEPYQAISLELDVMLNLLNLRKQKETETQ